MKIMGSNYIENDGADDDDDDNVIDSGPVRRL